MTEQEKLALSALVDALQKEQNEKSRHTGFGYGFHRWVHSVAMAEQLGISYQQSRKIYRKLQAAGIVEVAKWRPGQYLMVSTAGWDNFINKGDYFIEEEK